MDFAVCISHIDCIVFKPSVETGEDPIEYEVAIRKRIYEDAYDVSWQAHTVQCRMYTSVFINPFSRVIPVEF